MKCIKWARNWRSILGTQTSFLASDTPPPPVWDIPSGRCFFTGALDGHPHGSHYPQKSPDSSSFHIPSPHPSLGSPRSSVREGTQGQPYPPPPPRGTFRGVVAPLRGPGQSPVRPFACCVGSLRSVGRCGRCSCWCRFRVRGAQWYRSQSPLGRGLVRGFNRKGEWGAPQRKTSKVSLISA